MRTIPTDLAADLTSNSTTLCRLWKVTRVDGTILRFTDTSHDVVISGDGTYKSNPGFTTSAIQSSANQAAQNVTITVGMITGGITEGDLRAQKYSMARGDLLFCNYLAPAHGVGNLFSGIFGQVQIGDKGRAVIEMLPLSSIGRPLGSENYSPTCRNVFGDFRCNRNGKTLLQTVTETFTVASVIASNHFTADAFAGTADGPQGGQQGDGYWDGAVVTWATGANAATTSAVTTSTEADSSITLAGAPANPVVIGDTGSITRTSTSAVPFTVVTVPTTMTFTAAALTQADAFWAGGQVQWLTGSNAGTTANVRGSTNSMNGASLTSAPLSAISPGDTGIIFPGCDKKLSTCRVRYDNMQNLRGEPEIPTQLNWISIVTYGGEPAGEGV